MDFISQVGGKNCISTRGTQEFYVSKLRPKILYQQTKTKTLHKQEEAKIL